jgi:hypothetical protein
MRRFYLSILSLIVILPGLYCTVVFADTCPDPQEVKGGNLPPNWDEMDRPLNYASYFGEVANNLEYVERFDRVEIDTRSAICRYYPNVSLQNFASFEPVDKSMWREKEFVWTCTKGWQDCEFQ